MNIQTTTKIGDLLNAYPELEEKLKELAPPYRHLENPLLRKTVAKIATLEKVAEVGGFTPDEFVRRIREMLNLSTSEQEEEKIMFTVNEQDPQWISGTPAEEVDGVKMLEKGVHPLASVQSLMKKLDTGEFVLLVTDFRPAPLIDKMEEAGYEVYVKTEASNQILTFIRKN